VPGETGVQEGLPHRSYSPQQGQSCLRAVDNGEDATGMKVFDSGGNLLAPTSRLRGRIETVMWWSTSLGGGHQRRSVTCLSSSWCRAHGRREGEEDGPLPWRIRSKGYRAAVLVVGPQLLGFGQVCPFPFFCSNSFSVFWVKF
jgi:hypothetical protein